MQVCNGADERHKIAAVYTCRECEQSVNTSTEVCPYCGVDLSVTSSEEQPRKRPSLASVLLRYGVVIAAMWAFLWYILPDRSADPKVRAETTAVTVVREVHEALSTYAQAQGGAYPVTLEALGERVRPAAQRAQGEGYRLNYVQGPPGADGNSTTFGLQARAGNYGYRSFFVDQTGVVRVTAENRAATVEDPPI